jgi:hypothetical protein
MGMFFPLGIRWIRKQTHDLIPWAWGINGCASVLGSIVAFILAISFGFSVALWSALACYILAGLLLVQFGARMGGEADDLTRF